MDSCLQKKVGFVLSNSSQVDSAETFRKLLDFYGQKCEVIEIFKPSELEEGLCQNSCISSLGKMDRDQVSSYLNQKKNKADSKKTPYNNSVTLMFYNTCLGPKNSFSQRSVKSLLLKIRKIKNRKVAMVFFAHQNEKIPAFFWQTKSGFGAPCFLFVEETAHDRKKINKEYTAVQYMFPFPKKAHQSSQKKTSGNAKEISQALEEYNFPSCTDPIFKATTSFRETCSDLDLWYADMTSGGSITNDMYKEYFESSVQNCCKDLPATKNARKPNRSQSSKYAMEKNCNSAQTKKWFHSHGKLSGNKEAMDFFDFFQTTGVQASLGNYVHMQESDKYLVSSALENSFMVFDISKRVEEKKNSNSCF